MAGMIQQIPRSEDSQFIPRKTRFVRGEWFNGEYTQEEVIDMQQYQVKWSVNTPRTQGSGFVPGGPFTKEYADQLALDSNKRFKPLHYVVVPA